MTDFVFHSFFECEDGRAARLETAKMGIPVNVFAEEDTDFDLRDGEACKAELFSVGSQDTGVYPDEAAFEKSGSNMAVLSMIPAGTFPAMDGAEGFEESPWIIYVGTVKEVDTDPEAGPDQPNYCLTVETLEMTVTVYLHYDGPIEPGYILHGTAWLFADVTSA